MPSPACEVTRAKSKRPACNSKTRFARSPLFWAALAAVMAAVAMAQAPEGSSPLENNMGPQVTALEMIEPSLAMIEVRPAPGGAVGPGPMGPRMVGMGVFVSPSYVLVPMDFARPNRTIQVRRWDGATFPADVVGLDVISCLAVLRVPDGSGVPFRAGQGSEPVPGQSVLIAANGPGLPGTMVNGVVAATELLMRTPESPLQVEVFAVLAPLPPESVGGIVFDTQGKVLGMMVACSPLLPPGLAPPPPGAPRGPEPLPGPGGRRGRGPGAPGRPLAGSPPPGAGPSPLPPGAFFLCLPAPTVAFVASQMIQQGVVFRGLLGVRVCTTPLDVVRATGIQDEPGAMVEWVQDGSPAAAAGVQKFDIIRAIGRRLVKNSLDLLRYLERHPGEEVDLGVLRGRRLMPVRVRLERFAYPPSTQGPPGAALLPARRGGWLGIDCNPISDAVSAQTGVPPDRGIVVMRVVPGSPAEAAGVRPGDILVRILVPEGQELPAARSAPDRSVSGPGTFESGGGMDVSLETLVQEDPSRRFARALRGLSPGQTVILEVQRASEPALPGPEGPAPLPGGQAPGPLQILHLTATLGSAPSAPLAPLPGTFLGFGEPCCISL